MVSTNTLFYGDNLDILRSREYFPDECVDLIYLDPPFNSSRSYNVLFKDESGSDSDAQITAFEDTWHWGRTSRDTLNELLTDAAPQVSTAMDALHRLIGENQMMAYLVMMTARLVELHRVLKPTGSLYLHCDPTASHYLKVILDAIFGPTNFRNEIVWKRTTAHSDTSQGKVLHMGRIHDVILYYTKSDDATRNEVYADYDEGYVNKTYRLVDENGRKYTLDNITGPGGASKGNPQYEFLGVTRYWRYSKERMQQLYEEGRIIQTKPGNVPRYKRYLDEMPGVALQDLWTDIGSLQSHSSERLGYPTQKPIALLERIIQASSNPGDVVLDPFCGCGTAVAAAQKLGRTWVGIDITHLSIALMKFRLKDMFPDITFDVVGEPTTPGGAQQLAEEDRFQFQWWALSLVKAKPLGATGSSKKGKKGADKGIDGVITFVEQDNKPHRVLIQVKSGKVSSRDIRDLVGTVERENAAIGVFITLEDPTKPMRDEALSAGTYHSEFWGRDYDRVQILTIDELLDGKTIQMPAQRRSFKEAEKVKDAGPEQQKLM